MEKGYNNSLRFINGLRELEKNVASCEKVRGCLLDYLGVLAGGITYLRSSSCPLLDEFCGGSMQEETMVDGFAAHVLELDDGHQQGMIHLGASIITAVLAITEKEKLSSASTLKCIVMGYEAAVRCARAIQPGHKVRGYHVSGTCGTIGSAMGVAFACG